MVSSPHSDRVRIPTGTSQTATTPPGHLFTKNLDFLVHANLLLGKVACGRSYVRGGDQRGFTLKVRGSTTAAKTPGDVGVLSANARISSRSALRSERIAPSERATCSSDGADPHAKETAATAMAFTILRLRVITPARAQGFFGCNVEPLTTLRDAQYPLASQVNAM